MNQEIRCLNYSVVAIPSYELGPFQINGDYAQGEYNLVFSVTESPLIPSINRGRKVINEAGGPQTRVLKDEMTRAPLLSTPSPRHAEELRHYLQTHFPVLRSIAERTTSYGALSSIEALIHENDVYLRIGMETGDAAGHNMAEKAAQAIVEHLQELYPATKLISISSNYCADKKAAAIHQERGRGKSVLASVQISPDLLRRYLHTTSEAIVNLNEKKNIVGSRLAGSLGHNAHHANIVAALYLATGQDIANVVEGSLGTTRASVGENNDLLFSVELPSLVVGTVGGGTSLPYARANLETMNCYGSGNPIGSNGKKLAELCAVAVLAGELSLMAALTNNDEVLKTHLQYER